MKAKIWVLCTVLTYENAPAMLAGSWLPGWQARSPHCPKYSWGVLVGGKATGDGCCHQLYPFAENDRGRHWRPRGRHSVVQRDRSRVIIL
jgi:hypothetical protein